MSAWVNTECDVLFITFIICGMVDSFNYDNTAALILMLSKFTLINVVEDLNWYVIAYTYDWKFSKLLTDYKKYFQ